MIPEKRECPRCFAMHEFEHLLASRVWEFTCACGARLELQWEDIETIDGPEDCYWFEIIQPRGRVITE